MVPGDRIVARMERGAEPVYFGTYLGVANDQPILYPPCSKDVYLHGTWTVEKDPNRDDSSRAAVRLEAMDAYFNAQREPISDAVGTYLFAPGSYVAFLASDEPRHGVYLLSQSRRDGSKMAVVTIHDDGGVRLRDEATGEFYALSDWRVLGYAWAEILPSNGGAPDVNIRAQGIGPSSIRLV